LGGVFLSVYFLGELKNNNIGFKVNQLSNLSVGSSKVILLVRTGLTKSRRQQMKFQISAKRTVELEAVIEASSESEAEGILDEMLAEDFTEVTASFDIHHIWEIDDDAVVTFDPKSVVEFSTNN
jgi:hypothetical protein